jgi:hypothetical protein
LSFVELVAGSGAGSATRIIPAGALPHETGGARAAAADVDTDPESTTVVVAPPRPGDPDTNPGFHLPDPTRLPRWLPAALALVALALVLLVALKACGSGDEVATSTGGGGPTSSEATAPTTVEVVAADYVGEPVADAKAELQGIGLRVDVQRTAGGGPVGTVKGVSPTGTVEADGLVTLEVVSEPAPGPAKDTTRSKPKGKPGKDDGHGKGKG